MAFFIGHKTMADKKTFLLFTDLSVPFKSLSDEDAGKLIKAIFEYQNGGLMQKLPPQVNMAFLFIKQQLDRSDEHYEAICERNRINGAKGGRPSKPKEPSGFFGNPEEPKQTLPNPNLNPKSNPKEEDIVTAAQQDKKDKEKELGKKAKLCLTYYFKKHIKIRGFDPIVAGGRDMKLFKEILRSGYEVDVFEKVTDYFFAYSKRVNFTTRALYNSFDTLFGVLKDKEEGRR